MAVEYGREGNVGYVTLNKPPANSYDYSFMEELGESVNEAASDAGARAVILRSASERFFSAGADIKAFNQNPPEENMDMIRLAHENLARIAELPKVFIAQIGATALGGGLEMALACDLRFGAEGEYYLGLPEATLGLLPGNGGTQRLPRLIGAPKALDLMITGRRLSPPEAHELGILDRLFPAGSLEEETLKYAQGLADGAAQAIGSIKLAVHRGMDKPLAEGLGIERELVEPLFSSEESKEGIGAFMEKRKPEFAKQT
ncbi:enoyl-CoA hydratase/isomerase family protein [Rubrobacter marinus]|uniref:Enoyl-CoA hydratase/isomerase family protein n=1 Tax=Rubrobacter marinus TaxID=2653852 RepID=A0A6G8PXA5_9ACTN|nr:enoyl-CoA hydratase-related protein [Rubrobacter marinus]QIN78767.1 enoyl-CoA hydratase/isomerase family protein [Rubrobacter marinus]